MKTQKMSHIHHQICLFQFNLTNQYNSQNYLHHKNENSFQKNLFYDLYLSKFYELFSENSKLTLDYINQIDVLKKYQNHSHYIFMLIRKNIL